MDSDSRHATNILLDINTSLEDILCSSRWEHAQGKQNENNKNAKKYEQTIINNLPLIKNIMLFFILFIYIRHYFRDLKRKSLSNTSELLPEMKYLV